MLDQRHLVERDPGDALGVLGVLVAAALLQALQRAVVAGGPHERAAARVDVGLAAAEIECGRLARELSALEVGLVCDEVGAAAGRRRTPAAAGREHALVSGVEALFATPLLGEAGGEELLGVLLGALAQSAHALEPE